MIDSINNSVESENCVVMLHGYGANKYDLFELKQFFPKIHVISLEGPLDLAMMGAPGGRAWFNLEFTPYGISYNEEEIVDVLTKLAKEIKSIKDRFKNVILLGFSQGCILTHGLLLQNPDLISAAICLSGRFSERVFLDDFKPNLDGKPVFISHGLYDDVIPIQSGRQIMDFYKTTQADVTIKEYGMGHEISPNCTHDFEEWFTKLNI
jgi:phospholipase/carboxylesterase